ncbi:MAG: tetratricopeptide repeat protein [Candidatus Cloacimonadaceae bacterium]|nr:tetratricopeptide repeat protein [Candidatus Cloacimonadaceae bacterium]
MVKSVKPVSKKRDIGINKKLKELLGSFAIIDKLDRRQIMDLMADMRAVLHQHEDVLDTEERARLYLALGEAGLRTGGFVDAETDYQKGQKLCSELADPAYKVRAVNGICTLRAIQSDYLSAIEGWQNLLSEVTDLKTRADINNNLGIAFSMTDRHQQALNCQYQCLNIDEEMGREAEMAIDHFNLASSYMKLRQWDKSLELYAKAVASFEKDKNYRYLSFAFSNLSMLHTDMRELDTALDYALRSLKLKEQFANDLDLGNTIANIGNILQHQKQYDEALKHYQTARERFEQGKDRIALAGILVKFAWLYYEMKDHAHAEEYALKAHVTAQEASSLHSILESGKLLAIIYAEQGIYQLAHQYLSIQLDTQLAIFEDNPKITIARSEAEYYRRKAEEQAEIYLQRNIELTKLNQLISAQAELLNSTNDELEHSNNLTRRIYSVIGHDVRSPILTSMQVLSMIKQGIFPPEEVDPLLTDLGLSLGKAANLLSDLLSWSRDDDRRQEIVLVLIDVVSVIEDCINLNQSSSSIKNINIEYVGEPNLNAMAHRNYLHTIVRNLLYNAIKFSPEGGSIRIETRLSSNRVFIDVSDSGMGMKAAEITKLLSGKIEPGRGTSAESGTGFGISLCMECAALMGAVIMVSSKPGVGSKFSVALQMPKK